MRTSALMLNRLADQLGVGATQIFRTPEIYQSRLSQIGIEPLDLTPDLVAEAELCSRNFWASILERVAAYNENLEKLRQFRKSGIRSEPGSDIEGATTNPKSEDTAVAKQTVTVDKARAYSIMSKLGWPTAKNWSEQRLADMMEKMLKGAFKDRDEDALTKKEEDQVEEWLAAMKDGQSLEFAGGDDDEDEDDEDAAPKGKKKKPAPADDDEEEDDDADEDSDDDESDDDEDAGEDDEEEEPEPAPKKRGRGRPPKARDDEDVAVEDEEEDDEPAVTKSRKSGGTPSATASYEEHAARMIKLSEQTLAELKIISGLLAAGIHAAASKPVKSKTERTDAEGQPLKGKSGDEESGSDDSGSVADLNEEICRLIKRARGVDKALSVDDFVAKIIKKYPGRAGQEDKLAARVEKWIPEKAAKELGLTIKKAKGGKFYVVDDE